MEQKAKLLYIDDEEINLQLFKFNFFKKYEVFTGQSGFEGLDILGKNKDIKYVISDMKMPGMNGIEFITRAKKQFSDKKFFVLTGFDICDEIKIALESRLIARYFRKPFNFNEIEASLSEFN